TSTEVSTPASWAFTPTRRRGSTAPVTTVERLMLPLSTVDTSTGGVGPPGPRPLAGAASPSPPQADSRSMSAAGSEYGEMLRARRRNRGRKLFEEVMFGREVARRVRPGGSDLNERYSTDAGMS